MAFNQQPFQPVGFSSYQQQYQPMQGYPYQQAQPVQQLPAQMPQAQPANTFNARLVSSREEALTTPFDPVSGLAVSYNISHEVFYINSLDRASGTSRLRTFVEERVEQQNPLSDIVKRLETVENEIATAKKRGAITASRKGAVDGD